MSLPSRLAKKILPAPLKREIKRAWGLSQLAKLNSELAGHKCEIDGMHSPRDVSIVIPSYNDVDYLRKCIQGIKKTCIRSVKEIIIVDDYCQKENSERLLQLEDELVSVIFKSERLGFAGAVNVGISQAKHDVLLLNSDTVPLPGWLCHLQNAAFNLDPRIGLVSPKLIYPSGLIQYGGTFHASSIAPQWFAHLYAGASPLNPEANVPFYIRGISGACVYIKREVLEVIPGLDDKYWLGFEDVDFAYQAWSKGFRCFYEPSSALIHHESATRGYSQGIRELSSLRRFWDKWGSPISAGEHPASEQSLYFLVDHQTDPLWKLFITELAESLNLRGVKSQVCLISPETQVDQLIKKIQESDGRPIVCDWASVRTGWLASVGGLRPILMPQQYEQASISQGTGISSGAFALLRPEFLYVSSSLHDSDIIKQRSPWNVSLEINPSFTASKIVISGNEGEPRKPTRILVVSDDMEHHSEKVLKPDNIPAEVLTSTYSELLNFVTPENKPDICVLLGEGNLLWKHFALSFGIPVIVEESESSKLTMLDGYNCRTVNGKNVSIEELIREFIERPDIALEYSQNAAISSSRYSELVVEEFLSLLQKPFSKN